MTTEELAQIEEDVNTALEAEPDVEDVQEDPEVAEAKSDGWCPKDEWKGDPDKWVDAGEFNRRASLFKTISHQKDKLSEIERKLEEADRRYKSVTEYAKKVEEKTRERTIRELEAKRREAVRDGDTDAYDKLGEEIKEASQSPEIEDVKPEEQKPVNAEGDTLVKEFASRNEWFEKDLQMTRYMVATVEDLCSRGVRLEAAIDQAEGEVKQVFKHKLSNPNKEKPNRVMTGNNGESRKAKRTMSSLSRAERDVFEAMGVPEDEFLKSLEELG